VLLPRTSLKEFESVFLDGMTVKELKKRLNRKIRTAGDGYELAKILFDGDFQ
jgi:NifB/MoaA-like Fe-S oxidoreductase